MMTMQSFRALPRPLIQWVVIFMLFPFPAIMGAVDYALDGSGLRVIDMVLHWLNGLPDSLYGFMGVIVVGGQVTRTIDKKLEAQTVGQDQTESEALK